MIKINGNVAKFTQYPNKEIGFTIDHDIIDQDQNCIIFKFEDNASLIELLIVKRELSLLAPVSANILIISYMPYSRLDRTDGSVAFTLKYISDFINSLKFNAVVVLEPHSDVTCGALDNAVPALLTEHLFKYAVQEDMIDFDPEFDFLCFPDAGAQKSYANIGEYNTCVGIKHRDFQTGWIKSLKIFVPEGDISGKNVVIVDDLCSKGGTFIMTAKALKELGAKSITLVVAHCESTILDGDILKTDLIDFVVTSNTIVDQNKLASFDKVFVADFEDCL